MAYLHGKFVWFTLFSNDVERAKSFYSELFGWSIEAIAGRDRGAGGEDPAGKAGRAMPIGTYHVFKVGDQGIGGTVTNPNAGAPSHWISYLSVDDVDGTAKAAKAAGAKVVAEPHDVPTIGREATIADPQGALIALIKGESADPPEVSGAGTWHWNELWAKDADAAAAFLKSLGFTSEIMPMPTGPYHILKAGDVPRGGLMKAPDPNVPPMWLGYVQVDDADETARRAKDLGAEVLGELIDVPDVGRFGMVKDPTGAVVGFIKPAQQG